MNIFLVIKDLKIECLRSLKNRKGEKMIQEFKSRNLCDIYLKPIVPEILVKGKKDHISERENSCHRDVHFYYFRHLRSLKLWWGKQSF